MCESEAVDLLRDIPPDGSFTMCSWHSISNCEELEVGVEYQGVLPAMVAGSHFAWITREDVPLRDNRTISTQAYKAKVVAAYPAALVDDGTHVYIDPPRRGGEGGARNWWVTLGI